MRVGLTVGTLLLLMIAGSAAGGTQPTQSRCWVSGYETAVRCVTLKAPLDYAAPGGESVTLTAVVVPSVSVTPAPDALFVFAGGPGQAGRDLGAWLNGAFRHILRDRDIVLVDVRGTGRSDPLGCATEANVLLMTPDGFADLMSACAQVHGARAFHHSAREIVEDVELLRTALGYDQISIWGGSFGTRVAQHYARAKPERVRAVILDAFSPVGASLFADAPRYAQRSLELLFSECAADARCQSAFPDFRADTARLLAKADAEGVSGKVFDPQTGASANVRFPRDVIAGILRSALYGKFSRSLVPLMVDRAMRGDLRPLMGLAAATASWSSDTMALGMGVGYLCAEDVEQARILDPVELSSGFVRDSYYRFLAGACAVWPYEPLPAEMSQPRRVDVPALVISGELDPITPPESGERAFETFATGFHVVVPGGEHTNSADPCIARIMAEFLRDTQHGGRDQNCLRARPRHSFFVSALG